MSDNNPQAHIKRLQQIEREINAAAVELGVREKQLLELKPRREALEQQCRDEHSCEIGELSGVIVEQEKRLAKLVDGLEASLALVRGE